MNVCRQTFDFFPFVANIDCEKFIQEQRCTTNHSSRDPGEIRGKSKVSSILCSIPKRKGTRELNEFVAVRISSSDTTRLTEEKALRKERGEEAREDKEEEGGIVDRGIYCTTVGQRIDFMPHRFGRFPFPLPSPSFRV